MSTPRCALYARFSVLDEKKRGRERSVEDQFKECEDLAARQGMTVVARYFDKGIAAAPPNEVATRNY